MTSHKHCLDALLGRIQRGEQGYLTIATLDGQSLADGYVRSVQTKQKRNVVQFMSRCLGPSL